MKMPFIFPEPQKIEIIKDAFFTYSQLSVFIDDDLKAVFNTVCKIFPDIYLARSEKSIIRMIKDDDNKDGEYTVSVRPDKITLKYSNGEGAFHALITLCQLITVCGKELPCCEIRDYPALSIRGVMLDISRGKVPTLDTLKAIADKLAIFKMNHLQLYIEGLSFAYPKHKSLWKDETPITPAEIRELEQYCRERFIDLVPCQNALGHMSRWLKEPKYNKLSECENGFSVMGLHFPPTTLDINDPKSIEFVCELLDDLLPCFTSAYCNVCLDEPFELAMGKNKALQAEKYHFYAGYAAELRTYLAKQQKQMMMWGDVISKDDLILEDLPEDIIILDWGYEAEYPVAERAAVLAQSKHQFCLCPGTNSWLSFTGLTDNMLTCIKNTAEAAYRYKALGLIVTDWGDMGHLQYLPVSWAGILAAAAYAWNSADFCEENLAHALDLLVFQDASCSMGQFTLDAGRYAQFEEFRLPCRTLAATLLTSGLMKKEQYEKFLERTARSIVFFSPKCVCNAYIQSFEDKKELNSEAIIQYLSYLSERLSKANLLCPDGDLVIREYKNALALIQVLTKLRESIYNETAVPAELTQEFETVFKEHRKLWMQRNKPFGCEESLLPLINIQKTIKERN